MEGGREETEDKPDIPFSAVNCERQASTQMAPASQTRRRMDIGNDRRCF